MAEGLGVENLDAVQIERKCPCGRTNLRHILDPPPECLVGRHTGIERFAKLDLNSGRGSEIAKEAMRQHLLDQTEVLKKEFIDYGLQVYKYVRSVSAYRIEPLLIQIIRLSDQDMDVNAASFDELYEAATRGVGGDFLNYEPFQRIVALCNDISGNEQTREQIAATNATTRYTAAFERFAKLRTFSFDIPLPIQEGLRPTLRIKAEESFRQLDFKRVKQFQRLVKKILHLDERVLLRVADIQEGCVKITYEVIGKVSKEQFNLHYAQKKALASNNITMLEYAGYVYYCCCHLMPDDKETIRQLYSTSVKDTLSSPVNSLALEKDEHFPDCSYIQGVGEMCPMEKCTYCGKMFHFCFIEFHVNKCGESARLKFIKVPVEPLPKFMPTTRNYYKEPIGKSILPGTYAMESMQQTHIYFN